VGHLPQGENPVATARGTVPATDHRPPTTTTASCAVGGPDRICLYQYLDQPATFC